MKTEELVLTYAHSEKMTLKEWSGIQIGLQPFPKYDAGTAEMMRKGGQFPSSYVDFKTDGEGAISSDRHS